jgi:heme/copper-type cytochrome/quinol oxidase subunit 2
MKNILKNRTALSTVVTTLIILVVSVLLAGVVTYFAINVTSTRVQEENLHVSKQHVWHNMTGSSLNSTAQAAIMLINTGGRDVVLDKIAVRGQDSTWTNVYYNITTGAIDGDFTFNSIIADSETGPIADVPIGIHNYTFAQATNDLVLPSGNTMMIFIKSPDSISVNDIGLTVAITIFSSQAMYYKETNVQAAV